ncbi:MAG TPA: porin [Pseudomonadaceae bacterium]|nr:porin [Pseudomonadaceae bacterium]
MLPGVLLALTAKTAYAADKELLDILLGNGAITAEQHAQLLQKDELKAEDIAAAPARPELPVLRLAELERKVEAALAESSAEPSAHWTDSLRVRGYAQTRYSSLLGGDKGINLWPDRSVGDANSLGDADKNFLLRRARLVFQGDAGERLSFYIQGDFASSVGGSGNVAQLRDAYGDVYLTTDRVHRLRVGQSKVPFGFENTQSSSNRLALDRNDALNSAVRDERDLGVFYYYTPELVQQRFSEINELGLKHNGNYGMLGLGVYNGQGSNRGDRNNNHHVVARLSYPFELSGGQFFEAGIQAYSGKYVPSTSSYRGADDLSYTPLIPAEYAAGFTDRRVGVSAIWYPQPFGLQAEWNWGDTPALDLATNTITQGELDGGYVQAMMKFDTARGTFLPFVKWQYFDGANKGEANAPLNDVNDIELGVEWQVAEEVELTAVWHQMNRSNLVTGNRSSRPDYADFDTDALRLQLQINY